MTDAKKKTKMYFTNLHSNKDGKAKDGQIKMKSQPGTHIWMKEDEDDAGVASAPYHFRKVTGDFTATTKVTATMDTWLDAAGLLVQEKKGIYTKVGLEFHDDPQAAGNPHYFAAAYVHPQTELEMYSNRTPYPKQYKRKDKKYDHVQLENDPKSKVKIWFQVTKKGKNIKSKYSLDGTEWLELKPASKFTFAKTLSVGVYVASGNGESKGVKATFEELVIEEDPDWEDKPDFQIDFLAEAEEEAAAEGAKETEYVDFARKAAEEEEELMMARLSALQSKLSGDSVSGEGAMLLEESAVFETGDVNNNSMDFSARMREMNALRTSIMGGGGGDDDSEEEDPLSGLVDTSVSDGDSADEPVKKKKILDDDSDSDDDNSDDDSE